MREVEQCLATPGAEALTESDSSRAQKPDDAPIGLGQRNRVTVSTEKKSQALNQGGPRRVQKGAPKTLTCVH